MTNLNKFISLLFVWICYAGYWDKTGFETRCNEFRNPLAQLWEIQESFLLPIFLQLCFIYFFLAPSRPLARSTISTSVFIIEKYTTHSLLTHFWCWNLQYRQYWYWSRLLPKHNRSASVHTKIHSNIGTIYYWYFLVYIFEFIYQWWCCKCEGRH